MVVAEIFSVLLYILSLVILKEFFGNSPALPVSPSIKPSADAEFIQSVDFIWKTAVITAVSCLPLYLIKFLRRRFSPPSYQKLQ